MSVVHYSVPVFDKISTFQSQEEVQTLFNSLFDVPLDGANLHWHTAIHQFTKTKSGYSNHIFVVFDSSQSGKRSMEESKTNVLR
jgi:hypothetical protein